MAGFFEMDALEIGVDKLSVDDASPKAFSKMKQQAREILQSNDLE